MLGGFLGPPYGRGSYYEDLQRRALDEIMLQAVQAQPKSYREELQQEIDEWLK